MKKELRLQKGETLNDWCERLAIYYQDSAIKHDELKIIFREVSITSYTKGSDAALDVLHGFDRDLCK